MNHLKHIRGISVRASSNAALPSHYGQHANVYSENLHLKSHCQLLRSNPLCVVKKNHGDAKDLGQFRQDSLRLVSKESKTICKQRSKTKSSVTSLKKKSIMHKKSPSESITKKVCHYSTCRNVKFNSNGINKQLMRQSETINGVKNINRHSSFIASVEKRPRSYAEIISDYSESLYKESAVGARNNSFHFNNAIRKSPFSTFSTSLPAKKIMNVAEYSELSTERQKIDFPLPVKSLDLCNRSNNINTVECYDFQHSTCTAEAMNIKQNCVITNDLRNDQSYAKLIADCSNGMHNIPVTSVLNDDLIPKRNVLPTNSFESVIAPKKTNTCTQESTQKITPSVDTLEKNIKEQVINLKENDLLKEMENVMSDLKGIIERKDTRIDVPKIKKSDILQSVSSNLDKIHELAELIEPNKQKKKDVTFGKLSCQLNQINRMEKRKNLEFQKHNYSHLSDKTSNLPQNFGNVAESSVVRKKSTHASTTVLKQPQVKLRMVPSEKESIVSINVDQASTGSSDPLNSKHLSVIVQSDQKEELANTQWNAPALQHITKSALQRNDFGPMRISISEDSAPVKQIEFSINGKPVSELKSITARTERLDVVSSMDKIEIRIPFAKDDSNTLDKSREDNTPKGINSNVGQILNVQISANFQDESTKSNSVEKPAKAIQHQYDKNVVSKSPSSLFKSSYSFDNVPKTYDENLNNINLPQHDKIESAKRMNITFDDNKHIHEYKTSDDVNFNTQHKTTKDLSVDETMTGVSFIKEVNNVKVESLNVRKTNTTGFPKANVNNKNESSDNRVPSNMIPWWSSSDSFNKIRKKQDNHRPLTSPLNRNEQKTVSNLNQNLISKSSLSKPEETSNSKMKKTQTTSDTTN
ncbi:uncharacterized protein LOC114255465 isoform X2 [Monomorium pharaonis]|uniref:uncharacterized protein LOC114255465 isoform X2 n=1 Tax=Monomorium pharaonis TaxID=307658 RepID=UPI001747C6D6|nr:uncharacterized protein LOC114255465 isoform X2 [Monomorium pharaonis]